MSSITGFFERYQRNRFENPPSWPFIVTGIVMLLTWALVATKYHQLSKGFMALILGLMFCFYGATEMLLRRSPWLLATRLISMGIWGVGMYWALH